MACFGGRLRCLSRHLFVFRPDTIDLLASLLLQTWSILIESACVLRTIDNHLSWLHKCLPAPGFLGWGGVAISSHKIV